MFIEYLSGSRLVQYWVQILFWRISRGIAFVCACLRDAPHQLGGRMVDDGYLRQFLRHKRLCPEVPHSRVSSLRLGRQCWEYTLDGKVQQRPPVRGQCLVQVCRVQGWSLFFSARMVVVQPGGVLVARMPRKRLQCGCNEKEGDHRVPSVTECGCSGPA